MDSTHTFSLNGFKNSNPCSSLTRNIASLILPRKVPVFPDLQPTFIDSDLTPRHIYSFKRDLREPDVPFSLVEEDLL